MPEAHKYIGEGVVGLWALLWAWPLGARLARRDPGEWYWRLLAVAQVVLAIQVVLGVVLLAIHGIGARPWLHYLYGSLFPVVVIVGAHVFARGLERDPWVPFGWAAFIVFGLTLRALMTGLGIG